MKKILSISLILICFLAIGQNPGTFSYIKASKYLIVGDTIKADSVQLCKGTVCVWVTPTNYLTKQRFLDSIAAVKQLINNIPPVEVNSGIVKNPQGAIGLDSSGTYANSNIILSTKKQFFISGHSDSTNIGLNDSIIAMQAIGLNGQIGFEIYPNNIYKLRIQDEPKDSFEIPAKYEVLNLIDSLHQNINDSSVVTIITTDETLTGAPIIINGGGGSGGVVDTTKVIGQIYWLGDSTITGYTLNKFNHTGTGTFAINCTLTDSSIVVGKSGVYEVTFYENSGNYAYIVYKNNDIITYSNMTTITSKSFNVSLNAGDIIKIKRTSIDITAISYPILSIEKIY